jgi:hypothetical protein
MLPLKITRKSAIVILLVSGPTAFWFTAHFARGSYQIYRAQSWPEVGARVTDVREDTIPDDESEGYGVTNLRERLEYEYTFYGKKYISRHYSPFARWNLDSNIATFRNGASIRIYINPQDPFEAVADRTVRSGFWFYLVLMLLAQLCFFWALLTCFRHERYFRAFIGQATMLIAFFAVNFAFYASAGNRDLNWWLVCVGLFGGIMLSGLSMIISLWSPQGHAILLLLAIFGGFILTTVGAVRGA